MLAHRIAVAALLAPLAIAQQPPRQAPTPIEALRRELAAARSDLAAVVESATPLPPPPPIVSGALGVDLTTQYLFRGIPQEDQGVIAQPWASLQFRVADEAGPLKATDLELGTWNSLHEGPSRGTGSAWFEADCYAGASTTVLDRLRIGARYTVYHSSNGSFGTVQEVSGTASFDDCGLFCPYGLRPSVTFAFEVDGQADAGDHLGSYAELGIRPSVEVAELDDWRFEVLAPTKVGFSLDDYFETPGGGRDEAFGFVDTAIAVAAFLPGQRNRLGWRAELSLHYVALGSTNELRNHGDGEELIGVLGISMSF
jgi:hypothetical protein